MSQAEPNQSNGGRLFRRHRVIGSGVCPPALADMPGHCLTSSSGRQTIGSVQECISWCRNECSRCNFVTFSIGGDICSWFNACPKPLVLRSSSYTTFHVRKHVAEMAAVAAAETSAATAIAPRAAATDAAQQPEESAAPEPSVDAPPPSAPAWIATGKSRSRGAITLALITRSFAAMGNTLLTALECQVATLAGSGVEMIYVLDDTPEDHALGRRILTEARSQSAVAGGRTSLRLRVIFEPLPASAATMFTGRLNDGFGGAGKDRSQYSNFIGDRYTDADAIGVFDAECCIVAPPVASHVAHEGRLHNVAQVRLPTGDHWGVDAWALDLSTPLDVMWPNRFPIWMWRSDLRELRRHLVSRFETAEEWEGEFDSAFDAAFSRMLHGPARWGYDRERQGYSQFNIILNFMLHRRPSRYAFHATPSSKLGQIPQALTTSHPEAVITSRPHFSIAANGPRFQSRGAEVIHALCCGRHAVLNCSERAQPDLVEEASSWDGAGTCSPWHSEQGSLDCIRRYMQAARESVEQWTRAQQRAGVKGCRRAMRENPSCFHYNTRADPENRSVANLMRSRCYFSPPSPTRLPKAKSKPAKPVGKWHGRKG